MTNYVYQLRDGAIQVTSDTTSLFRRAQTLLDEDSPSRHGISFDDEVASLLERIDLEASGGFDALEAGEVPEFDKPTDSNSDSLRVHNTLHRLFASLKSIENTTEEIPSRAAFERRLSEHRRLLNSLAPPTRMRSALPLTTLEELLTLQLTFIDADLDVDEHGLVHPSYIPLLSSLITQLTNVLNIAKIRNTQISRGQDTIEIQVTLNDSDTHASGLRANAIERGFLHADAPLHEGANLQYLLLSESASANEPLIQTSALFNQLQSFCAKVVVEAMDETHIVTITLPANVRLEETTVFQLNGALYAVLTESVAEVNYLSKTDGAAVLSSLESEYGPYRVSNLSERNENHEACLLIDNGEDRVALFVDRIEPPAQIRVFDPLSSNAYIGGSICLLDRRIVILLSSDDLDDALSPSPDLQIAPTFRLLALSATPVISQLSRRVYEVLIAEGELDATRSIQEHRPQAILVQQRDVSTYGNLLSLANRWEIPVIVQCSGQLDIEIEGWRDQFKMIATSTELEAVLQTLTSDAHPQEL